MAGVSTNGVAGRVRKSPRGAYVWFVASLTIAAAGCGSRTNRKGRPGAVAPLEGVRGAAAPSPIQVEWAGCVNIRRGPVCELGPERKLTLWFANGQGSRWTLASDRGAVTPSTEPAVDGGTRITVPVAPGTRQLHLRDDAGRTRWTLAIGEARAHEEIERLVTHGRTGKYQEALTALQAMEGAATPEQRGPLAAAMGRMALGLGEVDRAEPYFRRAIAAANAEGRLSDVIKDSAGLFWGLVYRQQRYADAHALLNEMTAAGGVTPEGRVWVDYHAGLLAADTVDIRTAMARYRRAERAARRVGLIGMAAAAATEMARLLTRIGRPGEALRLLESSPPPTDSCARATRAVNIAWTWVEREDIQGSKDGRREKDRAIAAADSVTKDCPDPHRRVMALTYAIESALQNDDREAGRPFVDELERARDDHDALHASRRAEVLGRWYLYEGRAAAALSLFDRDIPAVRSRGLLEEVFRCQVGAGRSLLKLGHRKAAVARLQEAQALLETMLRGVPLGEGRGGFLSARDEGVRYLVEALVDGGATAEALRAARLSRSAELMHATRVDRLSHLSPEERRRWDDSLARYQRLRTAMEQDAARDWTVPRLELAQRRAARTVQSEQARAALDDAFALLAAGQRPENANLTMPGERELFLTFFPGPERWLAFAATTRGVVVRRVEEADFASARAAERVLGLFAAELASARRVRLLPYGAADRLDWQTVLWRGQPLHSALEVEYGLDVGSPIPEAGAQLPTRPPPVALVVANPTGDLAAATPEADSVVAALRGWRIARLEGRVASRSALLQALPGARLFHYAGHAQISPGDGLSSALLLGENGRVELADLLTLPAVPELVVLPACEAAGGLEGGRSALGLAQAFIAAGTRMAVAPVRPVADATVAAFVSAFYAALAGDDRTGSGAPAAGSLADPVASGRQAFRSAALAVISERRKGTHAAPPADTGCDSLRLLVP